jgi:hypothetical protein
MKVRDRLLWDIEYEGPFDRERMDPLRSAFKRECELKRKKWLISCFLYLLIGLGMMMFGGILLRDTDDMRQMFFATFIMIFGFEITVLIKLAYGNIFSLLRILETVKEVHLTLAEQMERQHGGSNGTDAAEGQS